MRIAKSLNLYRALSMSTLKFSDGGRHTQKTRPVEVAACYQIRLGSSLYVKNCYRKCVNQWDSLNLSRLTTGKTACMIMLLFGVRFKCLRVGTCPEWELSPSLSHHFNHIQFQKEN